jgi:membrane protease YdiL (CAAX protease family)
MRTAVVSFACFVAGLLAFAAGARGSFDTAYGLAFAAGATSVGFVCWALAGAVFSDAGLRQRLGWTPSGLPPAVLAGLVLGMLGTSQLVEWLIQLAGYEDVGQLAEIRRALTAIGPGEIAAALVGLALLPGIAEEIALRGFVQRGLTPLAGAPAAVIVASALFGLLHGDPIHAAGAFGLGLYLGTVVALCGSIRPAVLCHVLNNAVATLGPALGIEGALWMLLLGLVAGPWALWRTALHRRPAHPPLGGTPDAPGGTPDPPSPADPV